MCVPPLGWTLNERLICQYSLVDVRDPMVTSAKRRRAIAGSMAKFQIPAHSSRGHCITGTATSSANDATPQPCVAHEQKRPLKNRAQNDTMHDISKFMDRYDKTMDKLGR